MTKNEITETLLAFEVPAVRHLAWLCLAPQLLRHDFRFNPASHLSPAFLETLTQWDQNPETLPARLAEDPERRLGHYFERLYEVLLRDLLGWEIVLQNQQVQAEGRTLGELDFLVRNSDTGQLEHHEIAIKFYLGFATGQTRVRWYGPNARDRLDLKTERLVNHQSRLCQRPETQTLLAGVGVNEPVTPRIFMPGYLFYPTERLLPELPAQVPKGHLTGDWMRIDAACQQEVSCWVPLFKPDWIGPWAQSAAPDAALARAALERVENAGVPQLFAIMARHSESGRWLEVNRVFVMPLQWPGTAA
ncbi:DUF1853 family protein [Marinobacter daepoensis]|uniref:DUF1853 family protein n=1 Tax=Marinobacter daepoensis TaxID=262077 RepID=UPI000429EF85|nr:DUF1853 family protein [Marinobacter daepoensis]